MSRKGFIDGQRIRGFALRGSVAQNGQDLVINDYSTIASGYQSGQRIRYNVKTAKTGGFFMPQSIEAHIDANIVGGFFGQYISIEQSGNPLIDSIMGRFMYIDDVGSGCACVYGDRININGDNCLGATGFWSLRKTGTNPLSFIMQWEASSIADQFIKQATMSAPIQGQAVPVTQSSRIKVLVGPTQMYIPLYE